MKNTRIYDRVPVKDVRVKDPQIGTRTPQILISRKGGEYLRGDVLDANATTELAKSIHMPDIDKINNNKLDKSEYQEDKANLTEAINNANIATNNANAAASNINNAIEQAMRVDAELSGNVLTITNNQGVQKSVNLTDSDEHVTINMISNVEGVSLEGVVVNVYINNGATPLQYTTPNSGQIEFTVTKGATYKVVFPDVRDCASINPVQYTASVGNRIIDAVYNKLVNIPEHVKIILTKHDINGNVQYYTNAAVVVTIGKEDPVTYNTDDNGVIELDVPYGSTYSIEVPKVNDYYVQYNKYKKTYEANMSSRISKFNYYCIRLVYI